MTQQIEARPSSDLVVRAANLARNSTLRSINLRRLNVEMFSEPPDEGIDATVETEFSQEHELRRKEDENELDVQVNLSVRLSHGGEGLLRISCTFKLQYSLPANMPEAAAADVPAFAATNCMVHVWPYYRELVQSTAWRMGLPPFPLPLFRVTGSPPKKSEAPIGPPGPVPST